MKILNFGSANIDYVYSVEHLVKPGETISSEKLECFCGGKGLNQSIAMARAGAEVYHAGKTGRDGDMLRKRLANNGVDISLLGVSDCPSGHALIQVEHSGQNSIILFGGANRDITPEFADTVLSHFEKGDILVLQNEISSLDYIAGAAFEKGLRIMLNPSPVSGSLKSILPLVTWLILNEDEGAEFTGKTGPEEIARDLLQEYPRMRVVLTLGKKGVYYQDAEQTCSHGIYNVKVVDTTAAGDTFAGYFISCVSRGMDVPKSLELASKASSLAVSRKGASDSIPLLGEVESSSLPPV